MKKIIFILVCGLFIFGSSPEISAQASTSQDDISIFDKIFKKKHRTNQKEAKQEKETVLKTQKSDKVLKSSKTKAYRKAQTQKSDLPSKGKVVTKRVPTNTKVQTRKANVPSKGKIVRKAPTNTKAQSRKANVPSRGKVVSKQAPNKKYSKVLEPQRHDESRARNRKGERAQCSKKGKGNCKAESCDKPGKRKGLHKKNKGMKVKYNKNPER